MGGGEGDADGASLMKYEGVRTFGERLRTQRLNAFVPERTGRPRSLA